MFIAVDRNVAATIDKLSSGLQRYHLSKTKPETIYHYTTAAGATGITQSNEFWLSDAFNTNDQTEIRHGLRLFRSLIKTTTAFGKGSKRIAILEEIFRSMNDAHAPRIFFTSFSTNRNDINSFRLYGDETRGVMLGFLSQSLDQTFKAYDSTGRTTRSCVLCPIIYNDDKKKEELSVYVDAFGKLLSYLYDSRRLTEGNLRYSLMTFLGEIYQAIASFKVTDWKAEQEVRLFVTLLTKKVDPEVAQDGLRRPFARPHPKQKTELEYLKSFMPIPECPQMLELRSNKSNPYGSTLLVTDCVLGSAHNDKKFETDFSQRFPTTKIERSRAQYNIA